MRESEEAKGKGELGRRQFVKFSFYRVDAAWRRLPPAERNLGKEELCQVVDAFGDRLLIRSYSLMGMRGDADFLLWQIGDRLEELQQLATAIYSTAMGPYLSTPYSYLAMTRRSIYVSPTESGGEEERTILRPSKSKYLFVYPFVKTRAWYRLSKAARQGMMDAHIAVGRKYPSVKLNTTYSYGLDDQEFVVAFESDEPADFLDLVMELRETKASAYTLRDTPIFTCVAMGLREALDSLGAPGDVVPAEVPAEVAGGDGWLQVAALAELPVGAMKAVYYQGEEVALFNIGGQVYAIGNRCSHANGPLVEGQVEGSAVTCPWHGSRFHLPDGRSLGGPANRPVAAYRVKVDKGAIFLAPDSAAAPGEPSQ